MTRILKPVFYDVFPGVGDSLLDESKNRFWTAIFNQSYILQGGSEEKSELT